MEIPEPGKLGLFTKLGFNPQNPANRPGWTLLKNWVFYNPAFISEFVHITFLNVSFLGLQYNCFTF